MKLTNRHYHEMHLQATNSTFAIGWFHTPADILVVKESVVPQMKICSNEPAYRKSLKQRYASKSFIQFKYGIST